MSTLTVNSNGFLNELDEFVKECTKTYAKKTVADLSYNDMGFIRLVSSSSILSMRKGSDKNPGKTNLQILNTPSNKPAIVASKPVTKDSVLAFLKDMTDKERAKFLASLNK